MRSSLVVRASDCQCTSCNGPGFDPSIRRHSGIWGAADETVLNIVRTKRKKSPKKIFKKKIHPQSNNYLPFLLAFLFSPKTEQLRSLLIISPKTIQLCPSTWPSSFHLKQNNYALYWSFHSKPHNYALPPGLPHLFSPKTEQLRSLLIISPKTKQLCPSTWPSSFHPKQNNYALQWSFHWHNLFKKRRERKFMKKNLLTSCINLKVYFTFNLLQVQHYSPQILTTELDDPDQGAKLCYKKRFSNWAMPI